MDFNKKVRFITAFSSSFAAEWPDLNQLWHNIRPLSDLNWVSVQFHKNEYHDELFEYYGIYLPPDISTMSSTRKADYLAGRLCAKQVLQKLGFSNFQLTNDRSRCPIWPEGFSGSISHSAGVAICVGRCNGAGTQSVLGVDLERLCQGSALDAIGSQVLTANELHYIENFNADRSMTWTTIFSAKESIFKALYPRYRKFFDFAAAEVVEWNFSQREILFSLVDLPLKIEIGVPVVRVGYHLLENEVLTWVDN